MEFWRVLNWHPGSVGAAENGHPLYIWPRQGAGRVDDPDHDYLVLYVGDSAEGAVAEAFGNYSLWTADILAPPPAAPAGTVKALVKYTGEPSVLDLDDPSVLQEWALRPSSVVSRDRPSTQQWARSMFETGDYAGVSWWSFYEPRWASFGLWDVSGLTVDGPPEPLTLGHPAVLEASTMIRRSIS
ncbi:RES domain-containing protein [Arthrobacter sp. UYCo732]|uniref:RES domain-containing protein n=1 Tax=Arthrobacter sp. UYCo732 TaxID=3156336 RepID=UPI003395D46F